MSSAWRGSSFRHKSVEETTRDRRPRLKALAAASAQEKRRQEFIAKQKQARRNLADHARFLATLPYEESDGMDQDNSVVVMSHSIPSAVPSGPRGDEVPNTMDEVQAKGGHVEFGENEKNSGDIQSMGGKVDAAARRKGRRRSRGSAKIDAMSPKMIKQRDYWANQLCTPEWMLTVPGDLNGAGDSLGGGWYVMPRPEGKRLLLISANGETVARQLCGAITHRFSSHLPGGSASARREGSRGGGYCILDCIFHELDETFFVLDMMAWKSYPLYDCTTDFRFYWVRTKLPEAGGPLDVVGPGNAYRIKPALYQECDRQGLAHAYSSPVPFIRDGLLFYLKSGHYQLGPTPLVLLWKDNRVTRYLGTDVPQAVVLRVGKVDSDTTNSPEEERSPRDEISVYPDQYPRTFSGEDDVEVSTAGDSGVSMHEQASFGAGKEATEGLALLTSDGVRLGEVAPEGNNTYVPHANPGELLRFTIARAQDDLFVQSDAEMQSEGDVGRHLGVEAIGLKFDKRCSKLRPMADTWSKVVFQLRLRRNEGIAIEEIDARCSSKTLEDSQAGSAGTHAGMVHDQRHKDHLRYVGDFDDDML